MTGWFTEVLRYSVQDWEVLLCTQAGSVCCLKTEQGFSYSFFLFLFLLPLTMNRKGKQDREKWGAESLGGVSRKGNSVPPPQVLQYWLDSGYDPRDLGVPLNLSEDLCVWALDATMSAGYSHATFFTLFPCFFLFSDWRGVSPTTLSLLGIYPLATQWGGLGKSKGREEEDLLV